MEGHVETVKHFRTIYIILTICVVSFLSYNVGRSDVFNVLIQSNNFKKESNIVIYDSNSSSLQKIHQKHRHVATSHKICTKVRKPIHKFINEARYCRSHQTDNILCASYNEISLFDTPKFIEGLRSPCVVVERGPDNMFHVHDEYSDATLQSNVKEKLDLRCFPAVFILGMPKCGTTDLHDRLTYHHNVMGAYTKETHFFTGGNACERTQYRHTSLFSLHAYSRMFSAATNRVKREWLKADDTLSQSNTYKNQTLLLDSSPENLQVDGIRYKISHFLPNSKIIIILRHATEKLFSNYRFQKYRDVFPDQSPQGFHKRALRAVSGGNYTKQFRHAQYARLVNDVLTLFPPENVLTMQFEKYVRNPLKYLEEIILPFLELNPFRDNARKQLLKLQNTHSNPSDKQYKMLKKTKELLDNHFGQEMENIKPLFNDSTWSP